MELTIYEDDEMRQRSNLADIAARSFEDVGRHLGTPLLIKNESESAHSWQRIYFDKAIIADVSMLDTASPISLIECLSIQYTKPENANLQLFLDYEDENFKGFTDIEGFKDYEASKVYHFNGLDYTSTYEDVEKAFSGEEFHQARVGDLPIFSHLEFNGQITSDIEFSLLPLLPLSAENVLWGRFDNVLYWNRYFAVTFDFDSDGKVIGFTVLSKRKIHGKNEYYAGVMESISGVWDWDERAGNPIYIKTDGTWEHEPGMQNVRGIVELTENHSIFMIDLVETERRGFDILKDTPGIHVPDWVPHPDPYSVRFHCIYLVDYDVLIIINRRNIELFVMERGN